MTLRFSTCATDSVRLGRVLPRGPLHELHSRTLLRTVPMKMLTWVKVPPRPHKPLRTLRMLLILLPLLETQSPQQLLQHLQPSLPLRHLNHLRLRLVVASEGVKFLSQVVWLTDAKSKKQPSTHFLKTMKNCGG